MSIGTRRIAVFKCFYSLWSESDIRCRYVSTKKCAIFFWKCQYNIYKVYFNIDIYGLRTYCFSFFLLLLKVFSLTQFFGVFFSWRWDQKLRLTGCDLLAEFANFTRSRYVFISPIKSSGRNVKKYIATETYDTFKRKMFAELSRADRRKDGGT